MSKLKSLRILVLAGLFVALGIVLRLYASIPLSESMRIGLRPVAIMLSSITLGPVVGAFVGVTEDLVGATIVYGWGINPFITGVQLAYGILPGLLLPGMLRLTKNRFKVPVYFVVIGLTQFVAGGLLLPVALLIMAGSLSLSGWVSLFALRLPLQALHIVIYPPVTYLMAEATQKALTKMPIGRAINATSFSKSR